MLHRSIAVITTLLCLLRAPASAQILYGGLIGNVSDKSQSAVPGAAVKLTNEQTGATRDLTTNESGIYQFPTIAPGIYTVSVRANGFRQLTRTGIDVASASAAVSSDAAAPWRPGAVTITVARSTSSSAIMRA